MSQENKTDFGIYRDRDGRARPEERIREIRIDPSRPRTAKEELNDTVELYYPEASLTKLVGGKADR